ncbi:MAG TPA: TraM recognition domain-containing protein, partial [Alphaproteobacteria bacterium]|nr:TraM recognition domain-containing protein [Alphaproteobacteria bacterium]
GSLLPVLTWRRDHLDIPMSVGTIRQNLTLGSIIKLSRDESIPDHLRLGLKGYLETLPGYVDAAFDDEGRDKPMGPDQPMIDTTTAKTQHGYLSMQFTRSLQSLADDYGYIFDSQAADVDMLDVVLNRRILIVLIPALEKSADEAANLGKIVSATIKGMMGASLGATVEGDSATVIENKPTNSATPFMTIFDEVGYYAAQGMAVMAAQARSLGFSMVFSAQDLPALEKRVKEEARSIAANCNIKIFGKLEDPTQTKEFFEKTVGSSFVTEVSGFATEAGSLSHSYSDNMQASVQTRGRANYDSIRAFKEGQAVIAFGEAVVDVKFFFSDPGHAKAMRVTRYIALPPVDETVMKHMSSVTKLRDKMVKKGWSAAKADVNIPTSTEIAALCNALDLANNVDAPLIDNGTFGLVSVYSLSHNLDEVIEQPQKPATTAASSSQSSGGNPMGHFSSDSEDLQDDAPNDPDEIPTGTSWMDFVEKAEAEVDLDEDTKHVLEDAARKARESIFRSSESAE